MKAVVIPAYGDFDVFRVEERNDPEPGQGEVLIRVRAAGVNFADIMARLGVYPDAPKLPMVVGYEVAGDVEKTGEGASGFKAGDKVFALTMFGGYAEKVMAPVESVRHIPPGLDYETACAVPVNYLTAYHSLIYMGNLKPFETVLIHSAGGGVGTAAVQIARSVGSKVIGTASPAKKEYLRQLGVENVINYLEEDFAAKVMELTGGKGADVILDSLGGEQVMKNYRCLAAAGRLITFGMFSIVKGDRKSMSRAMREVLKTGRFHPLRLFNDNKAVIGVNLNHLAARKDIISYEMDKIIELIKQGHVRPCVDKIFPLEEAGEAHRYIQERKNKGKVVLKV